MFVFWYAKSSMAVRSKRHEQRQRYLKAKVAMALYRTYGRVPKEDEIDHAYQVTRVLFTALPDIRMFRTRHTRTGQLALF
jgi:hypothetical protein